MLNNVLQKQNMKQVKRICLFDVDGTLTIPRNKIEQNMVDCLNRLKKVIDIGYVGGSDEKKMKEQLNEQTINIADYFFSENGLKAWKGKQCLNVTSINEKMGEDMLQKFINYCLHYIADLQIPIKRGTFIEFRTGMINISPIGRNCSQKERDQFEKFDLKEGIRKKFIKTLEEKFGELNLKYSIGGQISFDVFPKGWDKTFCLQYLKEYDEIYFFGDKTYEGGNDYEIYEEMRKLGRGHSVIEGGPEQTIQILNDLFLKQ